MTLRTPSRLILSTLLAGAFCAPNDVARASSFQFQWLGGLTPFPSETPASQAYNISGDGSVVVGTSGRSFRWTSAGGMVELGESPGGGYNSFANAASYDGSVIVGYFGFISDFANHAFRWTSADGIVGLGALPGGTGFSVATDVSADGSIVVGWSDSAASVSGEAFLWSDGGGMIPLGFLPGGSGSVATAVSSDGSVVVGGGDSTNGSEAFIFSGTALAGLGDLAGGNFASVATAVSADGSIVAGTGSSTLSDYEMFRWTLADGMVGLGTYPGSTYLEVTDMSADGSVIVGVASIVDQVDGDLDTEPFLWSEPTGFINVIDYLNANGVTELQHPQSGSNGNYLPVSISDDGRTIAGNGVGFNSDEAWIVTIPEPSTLALGIAGCLSLAVCSRQFFKHEGHLVVPQEEEQLIR